MIGNIYIVGGSDWRMTNVATNATPEIFTNLNVGIGTDNTSFSSFGSNTGGLEISDVNTNNALLVQSGSNEFYFANTSTKNYIWGDDNVPIIIATNDTEKVRILSSGGITFNGDTAAANALDDYEEGYWTPTVGSGGNPSSTLVVYRARYTKIGRQVTIGCEIKFTGGDGGNFRLQGLPFNTATTGTGSGQSGAGDNAAGALTFNNLNITGLNCLTPYVYSNVIYFYYTAATDGASWAEILGNQVGGNSSGGNLLFTITYST
jgi:hypothetical protein